jgi:hypothetical protein
VCASPYQNELWIEEGRGEGKSVGRFSTSYWVGSIQPLYRRATIGTLPDDVLLEIFSLFVEKAYEFDEAPRVEPIDEWYTLRQVCKRWGDVVSSSPHRLNLRLLCTNRRPVKAMLDVWPTLPIIVWYQGIDGPSRPQMEARCADNVISALQYHDRVCQISLTGLPVSLMDKLTAMMQEPFPSLTHIHLELEGAESVLVLLDSFLGGSSPRLRSLHLDNIIFPGLPHLLLSANDLVDLRLLEIPDSGYILPQTIVNCLSSLTRLQELRLGLQCPGSYPGRSFHPHTRIDLPCLVRLWFKGNSEYLEDFLARIDRAPLLHIFEIEFLNHVYFHVLELTGFIDRIEKFRVLDRAEVLLYDVYGKLTLSPQKKSVDETILSAQIECEPSNWHSFSLSPAQFSFLSLLSSLEYLDISDHQDWPPLWRTDAENHPWLQLFRPFSGVKTLCLSGKPAEHIAWALQELTGERVAEVLPALQGIFLQGLKPSKASSVLKALKPFIHARRLSGHPVVVRRSG